MVSSKKVISMRGNQTNPTKQPRVVSGTQSLCEELLSARFHPSTQCLWTSWWSCLSPAALRHNWPASSAVSNLVLSSIFSSYTPQLLTAMQDCFFWAGFLFILGTCLCPGFTCYVVSWHSQICELLVLGAIVTSKMRACCLPWGWSTW